MISFLPYFPHPLTFMKVFLSVAVWLEVSIAFFTSQRRIWLHHRFGLFLHHVLHLLLRVDSQFCQSSKIRFFKS
jgi:hypothetical protein